MTRYTVAESSALDTPAQDSIAPEGMKPRILDVVEALMMERGFNAISYQDVSDAIGIRKASIHYHFPTKGDLGAAVIARYIAKIAPVTPAIGTLADAAFAPAFETFLGVFASVAATRRKVCLAGVLGAEFETLPEAMQREVARFYAGAQGWLAALLHAGRDTGAFRFEGEADALARAIVAMMEGALIVGRALGDEGEIAAALAVARRLAGA